MHPASYVFGSGGIVNQTGGWNTGIAFLFGLLSVQWTVLGCPFSSYVLLTSSLDDGMLWMRRGILIIGIYTRVD
jgi:hypothetical protein